MAKRIVDFDYSVKITKDKVRRLLSKQAKVEAEEPDTIVPSGDIPGVYFKDAKNMSELPDECIHLVATSPPYCVGMEFEKGISYADHWNNMKQVMTEASRVLVPGGVMALNVGDIHNYRGEEGKNDFTQIQLVGHKYQSFLRQHKVYLSDIIIWVKATYAHSQDVSKAWSDKTPHTGYRILISHDPIYIFRKKGERNVPSEDASLNSRINKEEWNHWASGIWIIDRVRKMEGHPAIFPDELVYRLVRMFSYVGDTVLDPFLGSGTTVKVARELGREAIGYEREFQYKPAIMKKLGLIPDEAKAEATTMTEYAKQSLVDDGAEAVTAAMEAEFFTRESPEEEVTTEPAEPAETYEMCQAW
jgi:DNA modification methylase